MENSNTPVRDLPIEDVYPNPKHYREVTKANVDKIAASIAEAGQLVPIEVWRDGDIFYVDQGHHRLAAMKQLGHKTIRAIVADASSAVSMVASNLSIPETELEKSRGTQLMLETGIRPEEAAAHIGESPERVEKAMRGRERAGDAAEDMTLDRLIAVADFEDDPEAVEKIMTAKESEWESITKKLNRKRQGAASVAEKRAIIEAAGCIVVDVEESVPSGMVYIVASNEKPPGATLGRISYSEHWLSAEATIFWYKPSEVEDDLEEVERKTREKEDAEMLRLALESMNTKRIEFVGDHLRSEGPVTSGNYLREFAVSSWENGIWADVDNISLDVDEGFLPRVYASILSTIDSHAVNVMRELSNKRNTWYTDRDGSEVLHYYAALKGVGYEPTQLEASLLATLETFVIDKEEEAEAAGNGATKR